MAHIKKRNSTYLLVGYRPVPSGKEVFWRCPDEGTLARFQAYEGGCKKAGTPVEDPAVMFGEAPKPLTKKQRTKAEASARRAERAARANRQATVTGMTLAEWVGDPRGDRPGPFFAAHQAKHQQQDIVAAAYGTTVATLCASFRDQPMDDVTVRHARSLVVDLLVCPACKQRAMEAGASDVLAQPDRLSAAKLPWDASEWSRRPDLTPRQRQLGPCVDDDGEPNHYPATQRSTMKRHLGHLRTIWEQAITSGKADDEPRLAGVTDNPWKRVGLPKFQDRPDNDDLLQALAFDHLERLSAGMPDRLSASIRVGAYGMMRRSELLGLNRGMVMMPSSADPDGQAIIRVSAVWVVDKTGKPYLRPWGKTAASTREPIYLAPIATEALRAHLDRWLSTPNPAKCEACRVGIGEHTELPQSNPHRSCDFANDAPLWRRADGTRVGLDQYSNLVVEAAKAAHLVPETVGFRVTVKALRATGATLLLEAGVEPELVCRMGRWTNLDTLLDHYNRIRDASKVRAARTLDQAARVVLGLPGAEVGDASTRVRFLSRRVEVLEGRLTELEAALAAAGVDPATVGAIDRKTWDGSRPSAFGDEAVKEAVNAGGSRKAILERLGVGLCKSNYVRLEERAAKLGLALPAKWAS